MIYKFTGVKTKYKNENIKNIPKTNMTYLKPCIIIIQRINFLIFENSEDIFINGIKRNAI